MDLWLALAVAGLATVCYLVLMLRRCRKDKLECELRLEICEEDMWK